MSDHFKPNSRSVRKIQRMSLCFLEHLTVEDLENIVREPSVRESDLLSFIHALLYPKYTDFLQEARLWQHKIKRISGFFLLDALCDFHRVYDIWDRRNAFESRQVELLVFYQNKSTRN